MYKTPRIADFRDRITLLQVQWQVDDELNRKEILVPVKTVWACIEYKNSNFENTSTGERPETRYKVTMRKNNVDFTYIRWHDVIYNLASPKDDTDCKYTIFEMIGKIYG